MSKSLKSIFIVLISILLAIGLISFSLSGIDFERTLQSLQKAHYGWVLFSIILGTIAYWLRSQRWRLLLKPLGYNVTQKNAFIAVCMNYFWNLLIPRSGEIARCTTLYALDKTPVNQSFGTVISERVIDFICLSMVAFLAFLFNIALFGELLSSVLKARQASGSEENPWQWAQLAGIGVAVLLVGFLVLRTIKNTQFYTKIKQFIYGLRQGLKTIFQLKERKLFMLYTLLIWVFYYLMTYLVVFAFPETAHLGPEIGFYLLLVGGIGMVIPASGGIGAYHSAMRLGFVILGFSPEIGLSFAFLVHTPHTLIAIVLGIISLIMGYLAKRKR